MGEDFGEVLYEESGRARWNGLLSVEKGFTEEDRGGGGGGPGVRRGAERGVSRAAFATCSIELTDTGGDGCCIVFRLRGNGGALSSPLLTLVAEWA